MKKTIILLLFASLTIAGLSQSIWKPVPQHLFSTNLTADQTGTTSSFQWLPRWSMATDAVQFAYNKTTKSLDKSAFSKIGVGMTAAHYINNNGVPYNNFSLGGYIYLPFQNGGQGISLVGTVSILKFVELSPGLGVGWDFSLKAPIGLINVVHTF